MKYNIDYQIEDVLRVMADFDRNPEEFDIFEDITLIEMKQGFEKDLAELMALRATLG